MEWLDKLIQFNIQYIVIATINRRKGKNRTIRRDKK
jgi:hypothetical protein